MVTHLSSLDFPWPNGRSGGQFRWKEEHPPLGPGTGTTPYEPIEARAEGDRKLIAEKRSRVLSHLWKSLVGGTEIIKDFEDLSPRQQARILREYRATFPRYYDCDGVPIRHLDSRSLPERLTPSGTWETYVNHAKLATEADLVTLEKFDDPIREYLRSMLSKWHQRLKDETKNRRLIPDRNP